MLAIDSGRLMCEPVDGVPKVDRAVTAALLSAFIALKGGDMVSLFGFDARPRVSSGAVRGSPSFAMIQKRAAEIDYSSEETNFTLALTTLAARLDRRSLVIIFTDFVDPISAELMLRTVGRLTERHLVLFMLMKDVELETLADMPPDTRRGCGALGHRRRPAAREAGGHRPAAAARRACDRGRPSAARPGAGRALSQLKQEDLL